jgi:hypothetical protein
VDVGTRVAGVRAFRAGLVDVRYRGRFTDEAGKRPLSRAAASEVTERSNTRISAGDAALEDEVADALGR